MEGVDIERLHRVLNSDFGRAFKAESYATAALRKAIITGVLPPGQAIDEEMIAELLNMSRMPVRQAMGVLESEGLVKRVYKRGVTVTELSESEINEIYNIRAVLEGLAIRTAVPAYTDKHLSDVEKVLKQLADTGDDDDIVSFLELNTQFHTMLYEPSEWDTLNGMIVQLRNNISRYMVISHHFLQQLAVNHEDHVGIYEACLARNKVLAEKRVKDHIFRAMNSLLKWFADK